MKDENAILVVDDDNAHRFMLGSVLMSRGYEIVEADDGSTAIEKVHKQPFGLVLMDIHMGKVSGFKALEGIRSFNPLIPVILMSADDSAKTVAEARKRGAFAFLTKPLNLDNLDLTIKQALAKDI